eukprot:scpid23899/ scgid28392/ Nuclear factor NF-kappa-B p100 subunit; DNA-binding factor KBF2; H2TF1; Lymphocyte translocation chromosome 10 protein; Nuclear factor of kappa light polypeptide gene enhancer in B-cells 2; Oncogene Lyt-10; Nuclear factor NF-kappa-B p52 subunit
MDELDSPNGDNAIVARLINGVGRGKDMQTEVPPNATSRSSSASPKSAGAAKPIINGERPYLTLDEQPKARGFRFRYSCEGPSHGGIPGESSEKTKRTYPTVTLHGYRGKKARIVASLICHDDPLRPHAHSLVGKNVVLGQTIVEVAGGGPTWEYSFNSLGILHVTKKNVAAVLMERYALAMVTPAAGPPATISLEPQPGEELEGGRAALSALGKHYKDQLEKLAQEQAASMNLSAIRLCFQAFMQDESGKYTRGTDPVVSQVIYDSKSPAASALKICRMHRNTGAAAGGDEIYILCDRVQRDDVEVKFMSDSSEHPWEADGIFGPADVHRQFAMVIKTPPFWNQNIANPVNVMIRLKRKHGEESSEGKLFTYTPNVEDVEEIGRKRKKPIPRFTPDAKVPKLAPPAAEMPQSVTMAPMQSASMMPVCATSPEAVAPTRLHVSSPSTAPQASNTLSNWMANPSGWGFTGLAGTGVSGFLPMTGGSQIVQQSSTTSTAPVLLQQPTMGTATIPTFATQPVPTRPGNAFLPSPHSGNQHPSALQAIHTQSNITHLGALQSPGQRSNTSLLPSPHLCSPGGAAAPAMLMVSPQQPVQQHQLPTAASGDNAVFPSPAGATTPAAAATPMTAQLANSAGTPMDTTSQSSNGSSSYTILSALKQYLDSGDIRHLQDGDSPVLHAAVLAQNMDVTSTLMSTLPRLQAAMLNSVDQHSNTMLHLAIGSKQNQLVTELVRCGANVTLPNGQGDNCVHAACQIGSPQLLRVIMAKNRKDGSGQPLVPRLDQRDYNGLFPAHLAVRAKSRECLQVLKAEGFGLDGSGGLCGSTPLHTATDSNQLSLVVYLLKEEVADINAKNYQGNSALHISSEQGHVEMVRALLQSGANRAIKNARGKLPIDLASSESVKAALQTK